MENGTNIAVLGLGYVGCVTAACFSKLGHTVVGVDPDEFKVKSVNEGVAPFYEPGLEELIQESRAAGRLAATTSIVEGLENADVAMICVGTPSEQNGNLSLSTLRFVSEQIGALLPKRKKKLIVVVRSTVFPGTCEEVVMPALAGSSMATIVANPEFLREGTAVQDFMIPSLLVVGGEDRASVDTVGGLYAGLPAEACLVTLRTAEMIKYACNCFHAVKITFANEIGALAATLGVPAAEVMETVCKDTKLNVSSAYLKPGFAFGGSCLPKDLRALVYRASRLDLRLPMLGNVLTANDEHLRRACQQVLEQGGQRIGFYGLAFKENTDDVRESPTVTMIEYLVGKGKDVRVFDPHIQLDNIYGANRNFLLSAIPHVGRLMEANVDEMLSWAETILITQKPTPAMRDKIFSSGRPVIDFSSAAMYKAVRKHEAQ
jgi:GDP-mannose 6-dehydrogenase